MTEYQEILENLFAKYEKQVIPGTEYFDALCDFASVCFNMVKEKGDSLTVGHLHSFIAAAYRVGFDRGFNAGEN